MLKLGLTNTDKIYLGSTEIGKIYLGNKLIYEISNIPYPIENITHYYNFNGNSNDIIASKNGTDLNTSYISGLIGTCVDFDGTANIDLPFNVLPISEFTVVILTKTDTSAQQRCIALNNNLGSAYMTIELNKGGTANEIGVLVYDGVDAVQKTITGYTLTNWNVYVVTAKTNDSYQVYVNGNLEVNDTTFGAFAEVGTNGNKIGSSRSGSVKQNGQTNAVAILNKKITLAEAEAISDKLLIDNEHLI